MLFKPRRQCSRDPDSDAVSQSRCDSHRMTPYTLRKSGIMPLWRL